LIAQGDHEYGAVFEDDVIASSAAAGFLDGDMLRSLPRFDIMQLFNSWTRAAWTVEIARVGDRALVARSRPYTGGLALVYHRDAARRIVRELADISAPIDEMLFSQVKAFGLRIVSVQPGVFEHCNFTSMVRCADQPRVRNKIRREVIRGLNCIRRSASFAWAWRPSFRSSGADAGKPILARG
jgi:GR25 family glycosyltransferase involved in LPS biosynthesis